MKMGKTGGTGRYSNDPDARSADCRTQAICRLDATLAIQWVVVVIEILRLGVSVRVLVACRFCDLRAEPAGAEAELVPPFQPLDRIVRQPVVPLRKRGLDERPLFRNGLLL